MRADLASCSAGAKAKAGSVSSITNNPGYRRRGPAIWSAPISSSGAEMLSNLHRVIQHFESQNPTERIPQRTTSRNMHRVRANGKMRRAEPGSAWVPITSEGGPAFSDR